MGKGDKKSKRGKITMGSYGVSRKRKKSSGVALTPKKAAETPAEKAAEKPVKKAAVPKVAAEKPAAEKKPAAKKAAKPKSE